VRGASSSSIRLGAATGTNATALLTTTSSGASLSAGSPAGVGVLSLQASRVLLPSGAALGVGVTSPALGTSLHTAGAVQSEGDLFAFGGVSLTQAVDVRRIMLKASADSGCTASFGAGAWAITVPLRMHRWSGNAICTANIRSDRRVCAGILPLVVYGDASAGIRTDLTPFPTCADTVVVPWPWLMEGDHADTEGSAGWRQRMNIVCCKP
jgi:hypothetical protein